MLRDIFYEENTQNSYLSVRITRMRLLKNTKNKTRQDKDKDDNKELIEDTHCTLYSIMIKIMKQKSCINENDYHEAIMKERMKVKIITEPC